MHNLHYPGTDCMSLACHVWGQQDWWPRPSQILCWLMQSLGLQIVVRIWYTTDMNVVCMTMYRYIICFCVKWVYVYIYIHIILFITISVWKLRERERHVFSMCDVFCASLSWHPKKAVENKISFGNHHIQVPYNSLWVRILSEGLHVGTSYVCFAGWCKMYRTE